ncbi:MAG: protein kinase [Planctomycetota bacterium]
MSQTTQCPTCGAILPPNAPAGLCPKCLMQVGLESQDQAVPSPDAVAPTMDQTHSKSLPNITTLSSEFPDLEINELIGQGGMGAVYSARQIKLDRQVALKIIRPESADNPSFAERFNREARTLARLSHPNIVSVYDFGEVALKSENSGQSRTLYYFLMEYIDGANLRQILQAGELQSDRALTIVPQICDALQYAHDEGVVHRDIKPENILVDRRGRVKIADFGLAKLTSDEDTDHSLTGTNQVMGTPRYMAPEQMESTSNVDHRADIYSLGVVFYEMLTGELPFGRFDPPSMRAAVDQQWDEVVLRTLEKEPQRRYQQASEVKSDVERMSESKSEPAHVSTESGDGTNKTPHIGFCIFGGVMSLIGLPMFALALFTSVNIVFFWLGMGLAIAGPACCLIGMAESSRLPAGTRPHMGVLALALTASLVGFGIVPSRFLLGSGLDYFNPQNAFVWIAIGLALGGGFFCWIAWEAQRPKES